MIITFLTKTFICKPNNPKLIPSTSSFSNTHNQDNISPAINHSRQLENTPRAPKPNYSNWTILKLPCLAFPMEMAIKALVKNVPCFHLLLPDQNLELPLTMHGMQQLPPQGPMSIINMIFLKISPLSPFVATLIYLTKEHRTKFYFSV